MLSIEQEIFLRAEPIPERLELFGFAKDGCKFTYKTKFMDNLFSACITVVLSDLPQKFTIQGSVTDLDNDEEYLPLRNSANNGAFTNKVRNEYRNLLKEIRTNCFQINYFIFQQSNEISRWIQFKKSITPEFPWLKYPGNGIFKCSNGKWFAAILTVDYNKLDPQKNGTIEVINLKIPPKQAEFLTQKEGFFPAYHMNKKNWISIILDGTVNTDTICRFISSSYEMVVKRKVISTETNEEELSPNDWIILCNPHIYSVEEAFNNQTQILWKQTTKIKPGSNAYIYVGAPYSCIMYKCIVDDVNIPYQSKNTNVKISKAMKITLVNKYRIGTISLGVLRNNGINLLVGPRRMTKKLVEYIKNVKPEK